jgi:hypothetical protein
MAQRSSLISLLFLLVLTACSSQLARDDQKIITRPGGAIVEVAFYDSKIHMPTVIPAGHITFRISNPSPNDHNFKITGNNIEKSLDHDLQEGQTVDFTLDLVAGNYGVICTMLGHADIGEKLELTVTGKP